MPGESCKDYSESDDEEIMSPYAQCVDEELQNIYFNILGCVPPWMSARYN